MKRKILSISRRTDIPALYSGWLENSFECGFCQVRNPFNKGQYRTVSLTKGDVDFIVFWTRYSAPLRERREFFRFLKENIPFYFLFTINGYPRSIEPFAPDVTNAVADLTSLSREIGSERVIWRYDPILVSNLSDFNFHKVNFRCLAEMLSGYTRRAITSIYDPYRKSERNMKLAGIDTLQENEIKKAPEFRDLMDYMVNTANEFGMSISSCCEDLEEYSINRGACLDGELIMKIAGFQDVLPGDRNQRKECLCVESIDIGAYDTCVHGCRYCYGVSSYRKAKDYHDSHNPDLPAL